MRYYPIVDGDVVLYRAGFAAQYNEYTALHSGETFRYKKDLITYLEEEGFPTPIREEGVWEVNTVVEPVANAINNVYTTVVFILDRLQAPDYTIYLTGEGNFRKEVAKTRVYKGNRDEYAKPAHYEELKNYLVKTWDAQVVNGVEADDAIADQVAWCVLNSLSPCIVSTDKDLDQIPGTHYNWVTDELYEVDELSATRQFWHQMITGDSTDNIQGIPGLGKAKANKILDQHDPHEWEVIVRDLYDDHYTLGKEVFEEHYKLVKIGGHSPNDESEPAELSTK